VKKFVDALSGGKNFLSLVFGGSGRLVFGGSCFLCRGASRDMLCQACAHDLPQLAAPRCPRCALASPGGATCGRCLANAPRYDATLAALAYEFPADALIHALKFRSELALAPLLSRLLLKEIPPSTRVDIVVAVPLSAQRLKERGYNQALELARPIAAHLGAPLDFGLCERAHETPPQTGLPWAERARNVRGAFRCTRALAGACVAVVDDVMTTGATLSACAEAARAAGARRVVALTVARALP
jgi:ComF family protein